MRDRLSIWENWYIRLHPKFEFYLKHVRIVYFLLIHIREKGKFVRRRILREFHLKRFEQCSKKHKKKNADSIQCKDALEWKMTTSKCAYARNDSNHFNSADWTNDREFEISKSTDGYVKRKKWAFVWTKKKQEKKYPWRVSGSDWLNEPKKTDLNNDLLDLNVPYVCVCASIALTIALSLFLKKDANSPPST